MSEKDRIKELEEKVAYYEGSPAADFYKELVTGIGHITEQLRLKKLDFETDPFAKSVLVLSEKSDKIMQALSKGLAQFSQDNTQEDAKKAKKKESHQGVGI